MITFRARTRLGGLIVAGLLLFGAYAEAQSANETAPDSTSAEDTQQTSPSDGPAASPDTAAPEVDQPDQPEAAPPPTAAPARTDLLPSGVTVSQLGAVDGPVIGLLDDSSGGLGEQMWSDADRARLEDELSRIPIVTTDPVVRDLARRLLLTRSVSPIGPAHHSLATIRLQRLLNGGLVDEAGVLASMGAIPNDVEFSRVQAQALLYAGRGEACSDKTASRLANADTFWLELRAVCYAQAGDLPAADLTKSILDAQGSNDTGFAVLLTDFENKQGVAPGAFAHPTAVDVYLMRRLGLPVTAAIAAQLGTPADLIAVRDSRNAAAERLAVAEQILRTGALESGDLQNLAAQQSFSPAAKADALAGRGSSFLLRQAIIHQEAALQSRPADRLALIERADPTFGGEGPFHVFADLEAPNLAVIPPLPDAGRDAWIAARALLLGGKPQAATAWLNAPDNPLTAEALLALDLAVPGPEQDGKAQKALAWFAAHPTEQSGGWPAAAALSTGVWRALSLPLPQENAAQPAKPQPGPAAPPRPATFDGAELSQDTVGAIDQAAADPNRRGEAILLLIDAIGSNGPARFAPDADISFVSTLEKLHLDASARKLAIECLLLGPPRPARRPDLAPQTAAPVANSAMPSAQP